MKYTVKSCGLTHEIDAQSPEEAAKMMMQMHNWRGTRSIMVMTPNGLHLDFLDPELNDGVFCSLKPMILASSKDEAINDAC